MRMHAMNRWLVLVLILAAVLRFGYQEGMLSYGGSFHNGSDSGKYIVIAETIVETGEYGRMTENGVRRELNRMPVYPYFLAGVFNVFGTGNLQAVARVQIFVELITIVGLALAAMAIDRRLVIPTALIAAVIPNFLVHTAYVLNENLFLLFFVWGMCAILWAMRGYRPPWLLLGAGLLFALSLYTRPVMMFFPLFLFPTLVYALTASRAASLKRSLFLAAIPVLVIFAAAAPRVASHQAEFGHAVFTSQSGAHIVKWVYPCLRTPWSCASHGEAWEENAPTIATRLAALPEAEQENRFARDVIMREVGTERIWELGIVQIIKGMTIGAIKNVIQTGVYESLSQFNQPATFFSAMPGNTLGERFSNFVSQNRNNVFMGVWVLAQIALFASRLVQLGGILGGLADRRTRPYTIFLAMTVVYFLAINGPIGNPKYRIPAEPALIIFTAMGLQWAIDWITARRNRNDAMTADA
ncbi:MAG: glycosyltransferase family 39 protein [Alphaproteobacteria bacterium]